jgi:hypothetical protein
MKQLLESPVVVGDVRLAPTTELAGLAELAELRTHDDRVWALHRIARAIRSEDDARDHIRQLRDANELTALPRRR